MNCNVLGTEPWTAKVKKWNKFKRSDGKNEGSFPGSERSWGDHWHPDGGLPGVSEE